MSSMKHERPYSASALLAEEIAQALLPRILAELAALVPTVPPASPERIVLTTEEVAELVGRSAWWVRERAEYLGGWKPDGKSWAFDREEVTRRFREAGTGTKTG